MTKYEFVFNIRIPHDGEASPMDSTISFTTNNLDEVVRQFNKILNVSDADGQVALV